MKIIVIGYMGSGKSSVGKKLASVLNLPFLDIDLEIEKKEGKEISEIFSSKGEIYFRKTENTVLKDLLSQKGKFVLATGGGTPCYGDSMSFILSRPDVVAIYLKMGVENLYQRLYSEKEKRPLLSHLSSREALKDFIRKHLFERAYYYNQAHFVVENENGINEAVEKIILKLF